MLPEVFLQTFIRLFALHLTLCSPSSSIINLSACLQAHCLLHLHLLTLFFACFRAHLCLLACQIFCLYRVHCLHLRLLSRILLQVHCPQSLYLLARLLARFCFALSPLFPAFQFPMAETGRSVNMEASLEIALLHQRELKPGRLLGFNTPYPPQKPPAKPIAAPLVSPGRTSREKTLRCLV